MPDRPAATLIPIRPAASGDRLPHDANLIHLLDWVSFLMDRLVPIPGTRMRAGLNSLFMLLPVAGDTVTTLISVGILAAGLGSQRVPRVVALRMMFNSLLDATVGAIPVLGDVFDFFFKADTRNVRLLMEYAGRTDETPPPTWTSWLFVLSVLGLFALVAGTFIFGIVALASLAYNASRPSG